MINIFSSAARTATETSREFSLDAKGIRLFWDITSYTSGTFDLKVQVASPTGDWIDLAGASIAQQSAAGQGMLTVYPGIAETANVSVSDVMTSPFRCVMTLATTPVMTCRVDAIPIE